MGRSAELSTLKSSLKRHWLPLRQIGPNATRGVEGGIRSEIDVAAETLLYLGWWDVVLKLICANSP